MWRENCMLCESMTIEQAEKELAGWQRELKLDGERAVWIKGHLINRRGVDLTKRYPQIKVGSDAVVDGEVVFFANGIKTDFNKVRTKEYWKNAVYVVFDVLTFGKEDLRNKPLKDRQKLLKEVKGEAIKLITELPVPSWQEIKEKELEGLIFKNPESTYDFARSENWVKVKNETIETFEVVGLERGDNEGFVALVDVEGVPQRVGIGSKTAQESIREGSHIRVKYLERTAENRLRQPVFAGVL